MSRAAKGRVAPPPRLDRAAQAVADHTATADAALWVFELRRAQIAGVTDAELEHEPRSHVLEQQVTGDLRLDADLPACARRHRYLAPPRLEHDSHWMCRRIRECQACLVSPGTPVSRSRGKNCARGGSSPLRAPMSER